MITSPIFVALFMSSPLWLGGLAYFFRDNINIRRILWSFSTLTLIINLVVLTDISQLATWIFLFSWPGILWLPVAVISALLVKKLLAKNPDASTAGFVFVFIIVFFVCVVITAIVPHIVLSIVKTITSTFRAITIMP